ncbi:MAG: GNAT family N-acetyltransferase [bacterium]
MNTNIRKATTKDIDTIVNLNTALFEHDYVFDDTLDVAWPDSQWGRDYFEKRINISDSLVLVVETDEKIIGYMIAHLTETPDHMRKDLKLAEVENTFIKKEYRRMGIGEQLYTMIEKWAIAQDSNLMTITASYNNSFGRNFYTKMGLTETDVTFQKKL